MADISSALFANYSSQPYIVQLNACPEMKEVEVEELVAEFRQLIIKARAADDTFEYYRLWEELRLAEAALYSLREHHTSMFTAN